MPTAGGDPCCVLSAIPGRRLPVVCPSGASLRRPVSPERPLAGSALFGELNAIEGLLCARLRCRATARRVEDPDKRYQYAALCGMARSA